MYLGADLFIPVLVLVLCHTSISHMHLILVRWTNIFFYNKLMCCLCLELKLKCMLGFSNFNSEVHCIKHN